MTNLGLAIAFLIIASVPAYPADWNTSIPLLPISEAHVLDGVATDWTTSPSFVGSFNYEVTRFQAISDSSDLQARFRIRSTESGITVLFEVADNELTFGNEAFGRTWRQDCVEVYFLRSGPSTPRVAAGQVRVSATQTGLPMIEGAISVGNSILQVPFF